MLQPTRLSHGDRQVLQACARAMYADRCCFESSFLLLQWGLNYGVQPRPRQGSEHAGEPLSQASVLGAVELAPVMCLEYYQVSLNVGGGGALLPGLSQSGLQALPVTVTRGLGSPVCSGADRCMRATQRGAYFLLRPISESYFRGFGVRA